MSKKTDLQSLVMLGILAGGFYQLHKFRYFARVDIHRLCGNGYEHAKNVINEWPIDYNLKAMDEALKAIDEWDKATQGELDALKAASLVYVMSLIVNDLSDRLSNRWKRKQVESFRAPIKRLEEFTDPTGSNFPAYDKGTEMMLILYELIKWEV
jgi:hypothetical protein